MGEVASVAQVFPLAGRKERAVVTAVGTLLGIGFVFTIAAAFQLPLRLAIAWAIAGALVGIADYAARRMARVEVTPDYVRFDGWGLLRLPIKLRVAEIVSLSRRKAPILPDGVPLITAIYLTPLPFGSCLAIRKRPTMLSWLRWITFRVEREAEFLERARAVGIPIEGA